jgi:hypothetical protein
MPLDHQELLLRSQADRQLHRQTCPNRYRLTLFYKDTEQNTSAAPQYPLTTRTQPPEGARRSTRQKTRAHPTPRPREMQSAPLSPSTQSSQGNTLVKGRRRCDSDTVKYTPTSFSIERLALEVLLTV